jgi:hypothetical protein
MEPGGKKFIASPAGDRLEWNGCSRPAPLAPEEEIMSTDYEGPRPGREAGLDAAAVFRGIIGVVGVMIMILGLGLALKTFFSVRDTIKNPAAFHETVKKWAEVMGSDAAEITVKDGKALVPMAHILSVVAVGGAYFLMAWISIAIMGAGGRIATAGGYRTPARPNQRQGR